LERSRATLARSERLACHARDASVPAPATESLGWVNARSATAAAADKSTEPPISPDAATANAADGGLVAACALVLLLFWPF